ncbi:MAG: TIM barrel protein [Acidaminococcaceae bacterium]|nr:TIM barrel protein [Acidaminococcaceae bacterium]
MALQLFNFCVYHDYVEQLEQTGKSLSEYVKHLGLNGIEHLIYTKEIPNPTFRDESVGAHLAYWPYWLGFWNNNKIRLKRQFKSAKERNNCYFGALNKDEWLSVIQQNLIAAAAVKPEYMVWHVSEADMQEAYTFDFQYSDLEVLEAAADVFNSVSMCIPQHITVLFENLWWPGLRLTEPEKVRFFFDRIQRDNVGIMLDTGHLMNTNPDLRNEAEAADYICRTVDNLGDLAKYIKGVHLSCSLSGEYQKSLSHEFRPHTTFAELYKHIVSIDRHQPFRTKAARRILKFIRPQYVTHELIYATLSEMEEKLKIQLSNC